MCLISSLKEIVKEHAAKEIGGMLIDVQTASVILKVYDAMSDDLKEKYVAADIYAVADFAWRCVS